METWYERLLKQPIMNISLKIRFDYEDGSFEELLGAVEEGTIHFNERSGYLDLLIAYKSLIAPLPYITVFIGIRDLKYDNVIWFNQGKFRIVGDYSYTDLELKQLHFVALNDTETYKECIRLQEKDVLDNDFVQSILISESKDLEFYDQNITNYKKNSFYITTKLCPFANKCKEIMFKKTDSKEVCNYSVVSFRHDLKNGTTKWELDCKGER